MDVFIALFTPITQEIALDAHADPHKDGGPGIFCVVFQWQSVPSILFFLNHSVSSVQARGKYRVASYLIHVSMATQSDVWLSPILELVFALKSTAAAGVA